MKPDNSDDDEIEAQSQTSDLLTGRGRFDAFDTWNSEVSNGKSPDGRGGLTRLTDLTATERVGYVALARSPARARSRARPRLHTPLPSRRRQIRQIRQIARRQGAKFGRFHPPGVKSVKWPPISASEVTL